jgi:murein DD-endopeptidase MepM/ murein hydrolase activator NlpD
MVQAAPIVITVCVIAFMAAMMLTTAPPAPGDGAAPSTREIEAALGRPRAEPIVMPSGLAIPVAGVRASQLSDTFRDSRSGGRVHDAIDIMAPRGTPVLAAADGMVEKLYFSRGGGGISAYVRSPDRNWSYYYAHLDAYAPGLREGLRVARGDPLGTVGSTGNANPAGPHLHFAIHRMSAADRWWQGAPVNPYPLLAGDGRRR